MSIGVYRSEIDGLRALAVVAVVLFHTDPTLLPGGFLGVDVFFIISGFLIGSGLIKSLESGSFSFLEFYERRARRLAAPLIIVFIFTTLFSFIILLPDDLESLASSLQAAVLMISNHHFYVTSEYFSTEAHFKPLLHTWSLSVEEQFYLIFPLLLLGVWKTSSRHGSVLAAAAALSFSACLFVMFLDREMAFYLLPFRAWELLLGTLAGLYLHRGHRLPERAGEAVSLTGAALIILSMFAFSANDLHPGPLTALPCIGTAMVIVGDARRRTATGRFLSLTPMVAVGRISYSLYLWHWPIIALSLYYLDRPLQGLEKVLVIVVAVAAAVATLVLAENPVRYRKYRLFRFETLAVVCTAIIVLAGAGRVVEQLDGLPFRLSEESVRLAEARGDWSDDQLRCVDQPPEKIRSGRVCRYPSGQTGAPTVLLWGDSHASALLPPLVQIAAREGYDLTFVGTNGCPPLLGVETSKGNCAAANDAALDLMHDRTFDRVVMTANWQSYGQDNPVMVARSPSGPPAANLRSAVERTLAQTSSHATSVLVVGQVPSYTVDVPTHLARIRFFEPLDAFLDIKREAPVPERDPSYLLSVLNADSLPPNVSALFPSDFLCGVQECQMQRGGRSLYKDGGHLGTVGAKLIMELPLREALRGAP